MPRDALASRGPRGRVGTGWIAIQLAALAAGVALCIYGVQSRKLFDQVLWTRPDHAAWVALALVVVLGALQWAAARSRLPFSMLCLAALGVAAAAFSGVGAVAAVLLLLACSFALGEWVVGVRADVVLGRPLAGIAKIALGSGLVSLAVFALALTPFNNPLVYLLLLGLPVLLGWRRTVSSLSAAWDAWRGWSVAARPAWSWAATLLVAMAVAMRLLGVLHPETGTDALAMHLVIADQLKADGTFHFNVTQSIWAVMPMAADWVLAAAHMLSGEAGARLANFAADLLLVAMVFCAALRLRSPAAALLAVLVYATMPLLFRESMTLYVENFWALWCFGALVFAVAAMRLDRPALLIAASLLIGTAFAAKVITLFFFLAFFVPVALYWMFADWRRGLAKVGLCAVVIALVGAGPYVLAWIKTGNPVFPFYNAWFGSPYFDQSKNFNNALFSPVPAWRLLFDATFQSDRVLEGRQGALGLLLLLVSFATVVGALRERWLVRWGIIGSILFVVGVAHFQSYLRYLLPAFPVLAVSIGACLAWIAASSLVSRIAVLAVAGTGALANLYLTPAASWSDTGLSVPPVHGSAQWREYRHQNAPGTFAVDLLDDLGVDRVLWFGVGGFGGANADVFTTTWHGWGTLAQVSGLPDAAAVAHWVSRNHIRAVVVTANPGAAMTGAVEAFLQSDTTLFVERDGVAVYLVKDEVLFPDELLENPGFDVGGGAWGGEGVGRASDGTVLVSSAQPMSQAVPVTPGYEYLLQTLARCPTPGAGYRLQVNWLGADGAFLGTDIQVQECTEGFEPRSTTVQAPASARSAMVYASGQDPVVPVEFDRVSFRKRE